MPSGSTGRATVPVPSPCTPQQQGARFAGTAKSRTGTQRCKPRTQVGVLNRVGDLRAIAGGAHEPARCPSHADVTVVGLMLCVEQRVWVHGDHVTAAFELLPQCCSLRAGLDVDSSNDSKARTLTNQSILVLGRGVCLLFEQILGSRPSRE